MTPRLGLVLSGGFLRGAFQVGVIEALPGLYGRPLRIDGRHYADGGLVDNVPYEAALEVGCERVVVVVPDAGGRIWKRLLDRRPHTIPRRERGRVCVIHPDAPLPIGRVTATVDGLLRCVDAGHRAAARALVEKRVH